MNVGATSYLRLDQFLNLIYHCCTPKTSSINLAYNTNPPILKIKGSFIVSLNLLTQTNVVAVIRKLTIT